MNGKQVRMGKLFSGGAPVVVALDHGQTFGPLEGLVDFEKTASIVKGADGLLMAPYMSEHLGGGFVKSGVPLLIYRLNWTTALCGPWGYSEAHTRALVEPEEAVSLGADMVLANLTLKSGSQKVDAENVKVFAGIVKKKEKLGIPLIGEVIPVVPPSARGEFADIVKKTARIAAELGADMIKTFYTGADAFGEVVSGAPIPVFVLGAEKMKSEDEAIALAGKAVSAGAAGVVFGRNVFQAADPAGFIVNLKKTIRMIKETGA